MTLPESLDFYSKGSRAMLNLILTRCSQKIQAVGHRWTYKETASPKNVVVLGGSYAGVHLAQRLTETLPTGYRAVLIEKNSHFNHLFVFPRFGVVPSKEHSAFVPYDGLVKSAPPGILQHIQDSATGINTRNQVQLASGKTIDYEYLAIATGSWQPSPAKVVSTEKSDACAEMRASQEKVRNANRIAVVGGGPVGIQVATDIKSFFPYKDVTLIHSRRQLLPNFGPRLHEYAFGVLNHLKVNTILGERPKAMPKAVEGSTKDRAQEALLFSDGREEKYDLVIPCTGQRPNSAILAQLFPSAICKETNQVLVHPTLQIDDGPEKANPHIFALGDVAKTTGPRMERAGRSQAEVVQSNIVAMINQQHPLGIYRPIDDDGVIKLTLGKTDWVMYIREDSGREMMVNGKSSNEELDVGHAWRTLGSRLDSST